MGKNYFPNVSVAYRILLTIPVTVASAVRSFSKLKLLKSYLQSTMVQERLNGLALIAIKNDLLETINMKIWLMNLLQKALEEYIRGKKGRAALEGLRILQNATLLYCRAAFLKKAQPYITEGLRF